MSRVRSPSPAPCRQRCAAGETSDPLPREWVALRLSMPERSKSIARAAAAGLPADEAPPAPRAAMSRRAVSCKHFVDPDSPHAAPTRWKERGAPSEKSCRGKRPVVAAPRIEHHLDDAFDFAVRLFQPAGIQAETTGDRRTNLLGIQLFLFDSARLDDILGESPQDCLLSEIEAERFHPPNQSALPMSNRGFLPRL